MGAGRPARWRESRPQGEVTEAHPVGQVLRAQAADAGPDPGASLLRLRLLGPWLLAPRGLALLSRQPPLTGIVGDELLGHLPRDRVGPLVARRLHQVAGGAVELTGDAVVERQLHDPDRVDHDPGG